MMRDKPLTPAQQDAAGKVFAWMACSTAACARDDAPDNMTGDVTAGVALPPDGRGCGRAQPIRGASQQELNAWCKQHEC